MDKICINNGVGFSVARVFKCEKLIPQNAHKCPKCGKEQYKSFESCAYCHWPLPSKGECLNCGLRQPKSPHKAEYVPCVLCSNWLKKSDEGCSKCSAPQSYYKLQTATFKKCENTECNCVLIFDSDTCYSCRQPQPESNTDVFKYIFKEIQDRLYNLYLLKYLKEMMDISSKETVPEIYVPQIQ